MMKISVQAEINSSKEKVWQTITNFENSVNIIKGIEKIEILEKPENGIIGLKWKETRTMFGKTAVETMWITDAKENEYYETRAESHGAIYKSRIAIKEQDNKSILTMDFGGEAVSLVAKIFSTILGFMFVGATRKAIQQDLNDIKISLEKE